MTLRHSRGRRPAHRTRTPSRVHLVAAAADHVAVEAHQEAHLVRRALPVLGREGVRATGTGRRARSRPRRRRTASPRPRSCPAVRGRPRCLAQRPLPSMTIATCRGHAASRRQAPAGGRPDGCGGAARLSRAGRPCASRRAARTPICTRLRHGVVRSTSGSERSPRSRCHCRCAATSPLASRRWPVVAARRRRPSRPSTSATISSSVAGDGGAAPAGRQSGQTEPPAGTENARCGPACRRPAHSCSAGAQPAMRHRPQQVRVEHQGAGVLGHRPAPAARRAMSRNSRSDGSCSSAVSRSAVSSDRAGRRVARVVARPAPRRTARCPRPGVTMSRRRVPSHELHVDVAERLEPRAEPRRGPPDALGDRADPAVPAGQQRDDPVGLAQLLHPQHDRVVAVEGMPRV